MAFFTSLINSIKTSWSWTTMIAVIMNAIKILVIYSIAGRNLSRRYRIQMTSSSFVLTIPFFPSWDYHKLTKVSHLMRDWHKSGRQSNESPSIPTSCLHGALVRRGMLNNKLQIVPILYQYLKNLFGVIICEKVSFLPTPSKEENNIHVNYFQHDYMREPLWKF